MKNNTKQEIQDRISAAEQMEKGIMFDWFKRFFEMLEEKLYLVARLVMLVERPM